MIATPWGPRAVPTGGAGVACPAGIWILTMARTFFLAIGRLLAGCVGVPRGGRTILVARVATAPATASFSLRSKLGDLGELKLDRGLAAEDVDQDLDLELVLVDLDDL